MGHWEGVRLHVVTGKGGTGKTTVAAALALALASGGRRVLLAEVEDRQGIAQLFDCPPLPYEVRKVALAPGGGDVYALAVDVEAALLEYLERFAGMARAGRALRRFGAIDFVTTIAPGLRDVILTGKVMDATRQPGPGGPPFDAVVLDAPPTGRIARFLNVNAEVAGLAKMGPIHGQAQTVMRVIGSSKTAVHLVTVLEEMPVQETHDGIAELRAAGLQVGGVIVNMTRPALLTAAERAKAVAGKLPRAAVQRGLQAAGLDSSPSTVHALLDVGTDHARRLLLEERERAQVAALDRPTYELPLLTDGVDLSGLYQLAGALRDQGAA